MYNGVEVSGHNLESSQTLGFLRQCLHYKPVSNHFCSKGAGGGGVVKSVEEVTVNSREENSYWDKSLRKTLKAFVPITPKNSASGHTWSLPS